MCVCIRTAANAVVDDDGRQAGHGLSERGKTLIWVVSSMHGHIPRREKLTSHPALDSADRLQHNE